jgi:Tol biopolymer transport system component
MLIRMLLALVTTLWMSQVTANFAAWDRQEEGPWLVQESEHFVITYPANNAALADKSLNIAERVHQELLPFFGGSPKEKTQMVLVDDFDVSNGWATFFPFAQIRLYTSPPDSISGLEESDDWLHTLIRHEYVHILHMEMASASPEFLRDIFGRLVIFFPHTMTPSFMLEGLATYLETNEDLGYGRLQSSYYAMQMRMEVADGKIKDLSAVSAPLREWPLGLQYLYGSYFYQFLADTYSEDKIKEYLQRYSRQIIPSILQNSVAEDTFGKDFPDLWLDYQNWLNDKFSLQISSLNQTDELSGPNLLRGQPTVYQKSAEALFEDVSSSQGNEFYFIANSGEDTPLLMRSRKNNSVDTLEVIAKTRNVIALDVNPQGDVAASRLINWIDGRSWADVYLLKDGEWEALTERQRLRNVRWVNNEWMIASRKQFGISQLILLNKKAEQKILWQGEDEHSVIGDYDISENGEYLIASMKRGNQGWNLERLNLTNKNIEGQGSDVVANLPWQLVTQTKSVENSPQILADGRILFSSDYNDIYNLYLLNPETEELKQLTDMLGGAFAPKLVHSSENNQTDHIIFQAYTSEGFEFREIDFEDSQSNNANSSVALKDFQGLLNYPDPYTTSVEKSSAKEYQPWSTLSPTWWLPYYQQTSEYYQIGLITGGADALTRHLYTAQLAIDPKFELASMNFSYTYDNRYLVSFNRSHDYLDVINDEAIDYIVEQDQWLFSRLNIVNAIEDQLSLNAGILLENEASIDRDELFKPMCLDGNFQLHNRCEKSLVGLGLRFDNRESYLNSPGYSHGRYLDLVIETNEILESDYEGQVIQAQWLELFDLPGRRSISLQTLWGMADKKGEDFTLGGEDRGSEVSLFGRDDFALRGYAPSSIGGQFYNVNRLNFTQWLARVEEGWHNYPIAVGDISAKAFIDYGSAWQESESADYLTGVGVELNIEVLAFYNLLVPFSLGYAHGFDKDLGQDRFTLGISLPY